MIKLFTTRNKPLAYLLLFSLVIWMNASSFPVLAQEQNPDAQAQELINAGRSLYQQESFEAALGKLSAAANCAQNNMIKASATMEMAYVKFLQGRQPLVFRFQIEEALKLDPKINLAEGSYKPGFLEVVQEVNAAMLIKAEKPEAPKMVVEKAASAKPVIKKRPFPWFGVVLGLAVVGWLAYHLLIVKTTLQVGTTPSGAKVYMDGNNTGKITPCELKPALGAHQIKVILDGYGDVEQEVVIKNGKNSLNIPLDIGTYTLFSPNSGSMVQREAPCLITWDSSAMAVPQATAASVRTMGVTNVDLELYRVDAKVSDIARGVPNSGSYTWNVPAATAEGNNFKIRISCPGVPESSTFGPAFDLLGFKEDFTDNTADFWLADNALSWNAVGGYYTASKTTEKLGLSIYNFLYPGSSYTVESRMRWSEFTGSNSGAPLFIMLGISNSFTANAGYVLGYGMDGAISITLVENYNFLEPPPGPPTVIYSGSSTAVNQGPGNWNTVKVVRSGSSYTLFINGTLVYAFTHSAYNPTYVMLGFGGAGVKTTCDFDYVHMTVDR